MAPKPDEYDDVPAARDGIGERFRGALDPVRIGVDRRHLEADVVVVLHVLPAMGEVLGHRDVHRTGATLEGEVHGFLEDVAGVVDLG